MKRKEKTPRHGPQLEERQYRVIAPHVPHFNRGPDGKRIAVVVASYPFEGATYTEAEAKEVLKIFTRTWAEKGWPADFEPVMVSADDGPPVRVTKRELDQKQAADQYLRALSAA